MIELKCDKCGVVYAPRFDQLYFTEGSIRIYLQECEIKPLEFIKIGGMEQEMLVCEKCGSAYALLLDGCMKEARKQANDKAWELFGAVK